MTSLRGDVNAAGLSDGEGLQETEQMPNAVDGTEHGEIERDIDNSHQLDIVDIQVSGTTLTARVEARTDATRAAGVERIIQVFTLEFREDKISALQVRPDLTDPETAALRSRLLPTTGVGPASTTDTALPLVLPLGVGLLLVGGLLTALAFRARTVTRKG